MRVMPLYVHRFAPQFSSSSLQNRYIYTHIDITYTCGAQYCGGDNSIINCLCVCVCAYLRVVGASNVKTTHIYSVSAVFVCLRTVCLKMCVCVCAYIRMCARANVRSKQKKNTTVCFYLDVRCRLCSSTYVASARIVRAFTGRARL